MSKVTFAVSTFRRYDLLQDLLASAERGMRKPDATYVFDNGRGLMPKIDAGEVKLASPASTVVQAPDAQLSLAAVWNRILRECPDDYVIISNDDVLLHPETIEIMVRTADEHPEAGFIYPKSKHPNGVSADLSLFLVRHAVVEQIGGFDERYYPVYFLDPDFLYRMKLAGIVQQEAVGAKYEHLVSATMKVLTEKETEKYHLDFIRCRNHYVAKWGGEPGHETEKAPRV